MTPNFGIKVDLERTLSIYGYKVVEAIDDDLIRVETYEARNQLIISRWTDPMTLSNMLRHANEMFEKGNAAGSRHVRDTIRQALGFNAVEQ